MSPRPPAAAAAVSTPGGVSTLPRVPGPAPSLRTIVVLLVLIPLLLLTTGCVGTLPKDSQGTLDRVTGGVLRVGVSEHPPFTVVHPDGGISGQEVELLREYAAGIDAEIDWMPGPESVLAEAMKAGELDVVIGGFADDSPFTSDIAFTRPYTTMERPDGSTAKVAMGVRPGENALMVDLELFLARTAGEI